MGILDFFQQTNSPYSEDMRYKAGMLSLGLLGGTMMAAGAPSTDPGQYGRIMAQGLAQAGPMMQQSLDQQMQMQDMMAEREREAAMQAYMESPDFGAGMTPEQMEFIRNAPTEIGMGLLGDALFAQSGVPEFESGMTYNEATGQWEPVQAWWDNKEAIALAGRDNTTIVNEAETPAQVTAREIYGDPGPGLVWDIDPATGQARLGDNGAPIAAAYQGGPVWQDQQDAASAEAAAAEKAETAENTEAVQYMVVQDDIGRALELAQNEMATGWLGARAANVEGSDAYNLRQTLLSLEANIAFDALNQMRAASQTGGALGNVTERELALLSATYGSIDPSQSGSVLEYNLKRLEWAMDKVVNGIPDGNGGIRRVTQDDFEAFTASLGQPDASPAGGDSGISSEDQALIDKYTGDQ